MPPVRQLPTPGELLVAMIRGAFRDLAVDASMHIPIRKASHSVLEMLLLLEPLHAGCAQARETSSQ